MSRAETRPPNDARAPRQGGGLFRAMSRIPTLASAAALYTGSHWQVATALSSMAEQAIHGHRRGRILVRGTCLWLPPKVWFLRGRGAACLPSGVNSWPARPTADSARNLCMAGPALDPPSRLHRSGCFLKQRYCNALSRSFEFCFLRGVRIDRTPRSNNERYSPLHTASTPRQLLANFARLLALSPKKWRHREEKVGSTLCSRKRGARGHLFELAA